MTQLELALSSPMHGASPQHTMTTTSIMRGLFCIWSLTSFQSVFALVVPSGIPRVQIEWSPLIGGPSWFPIHTKVLVEDYQFDFVPLNATSRETLTGLLSLQAIPGQIRRSPKKLVVPANENDKAASSSLLTRAQHFADAYPNRNLHLIDNNCWTFAWKMLRYLDETTDNTSCE